MLPRNLRFGICLIKTTFPSAHFSQAYQDYAIGSNVITARRGDDGELRKAALAMRAVSSGTGWIKLGLSDMAGLHSGVRIRR